MPRFHFVHRLLLGLLFAALAGCAGLPSRPTAAPSFAGTDTQSTALGRIAAASLANAPPGQSAFRLLPTGDFAFDARLALIRRAERYLDVQYYMIQKDEVGLQFLRELRDAANRGVRVRLLIDDLYTGGEDELLRSLAASPNLEVRLFNPLPSRGGTVLTRLLFSLHEFGRINHRMHNKLFVADNVFAVSGGRNMANEYFMQSAAANFIDIDLFSAGPVVQGLSTVFDEYWNSQYVYPIETVAPGWADGEAGRRRFDAIAGQAMAETPLPHTDPLGQASIEAELTRQKVELEPAKVQIFADSPDKARVGGNPIAPGSTVTDKTLAVFMTARSEVAIVSPYFIPGKLGLGMMKEAVENNVRIVLFTNSLGATDEPLVHWGYARYRRDMLKIGVTIYELSPDLTRKSGRFGDFRSSFGRLHAKAATIDRRWLYIGSMNLDPRSARANTEVGLVLDSPPLATDAVKLLGRDGYSSMYRLRLSEDDKRVEWVSTDINGDETVSTSEPHDSWRLLLQRWLLSPLALEDLL